MASVKNKLKLAREAIDKKDFETARKACGEVLVDDPDNYNANVFYALALLGLGEKDKSEQAYRKAIKSNPDFLLAWQGIAKLYEQTEQWDKYAEALEQLMRLSAKADDTMKCADILQKFIDLRRERSSRQKLVDALALYLPQSNLYPVLSNLPPPDPTNPTASSAFSAQCAIQNSLPIIEEIVALLEKDEEETFLYEVEKRRTRLNAPSPEIVKKEVGIEISGNSRLPEYYNEILYHPKTPDLLRRETESKLFLHKLKYLHDLPVIGDLADMKRKIADELDELANGVVLLGIPDELAWSFFLEGQDLYSTEEYDFSKLEIFIKLFPTAPLSQMLKGYFAFMDIPINRDEFDADENTQHHVNDIEDPFDTMLDAFNRLQNSILAHQIFTEVYRAESDYANCISIAESGLELVQRAESERGKKFLQTSKVFNLSLGTSLVHYYPPKHHSRALRILDDILSEDPDNIACLMGRAYILQYSQRWEEAGALFSRVHDLMPEDNNEGLRAREEYAWCLAQAGKVEDASSELQAVRDSLEELDDRAVDQARCWWRVGKCFWDMGDDTKEEAYQHFITSLKRSPSFAPAFTSLGIYYAEFASPVDPNRASKCFQKAFELDAREVEAARRLAEGFAEDREWDLVEVVAMRTIEGEGGVTGGIERDQSAVLSRFLPVNAWAWKAVGVVELNRRNYAAAMQSFQISLRADTEDHLSWLRLGEAYSKAGKHAAAMKALNRARELQPDDWISLYLIGEVNCQIGQFKEAIASFESILLSQPMELGVLLSLSNAYLDLGREEAKNGFTSSAEASFLSSINTAVKAIDSSPGYRRVAWKIVGDSFYHLSDIASFTETVQVHDVLVAVKNLLKSSPSERLSKLSITPLHIETTELGVLNFAVAAHDFRMTFGFHDDRAKASAWFDLGISLQLWSKRNDRNDHRKEAAEEGIHCLKQAVLADPSNEACWIALGHAHFETNAKSAQHSYIKALEINSKNVETWANLGLLYLHYEDLELANEAFYRAQTLDPDHALAWVGQGLVASANGRDKDAENLFEHAVGLAVTIPEADPEYASKLFLRLANTSHSRAKPSASHLLPAFTVLDRYCKQRPQNPSAIHLFGLVCERLGHYELATQSIEKAISILEAVYEESEDPAIERQFVISNTNIARLRLSLCDYESALESFGSALGLLGDDDSAVSSSSIIRTECHFGSGLAHFKLGRLEEAMVAFETALECAGEDLAIRGHVTVLLAQTLWAMDTDETRESAKSYLLQCISADPENLEAINVLVGMGILTADEGLVDAALSEILSLQLHRRYEMDPRRDVVNLLVKHHLGQGNPVAALSEAQKAVFAEPSSIELRHTAATLALQEQHPSSALAILVYPKNDMNNARNVSKHLRLRAVAECLSGSDAGAEALKLVQKAIFLDPGNIDNFRTLAFIRSSQQ